MKKKRPLLGLLGFYETHWLGSDLFMSPRVEILGSDGNVLHYIYCKSNDEAYKLSKGLNEKFERFVEDAK